MIVRNKYTKWKILIKTTNNILKSPNVLFDIYVLFSRDPCYSLRLFHFIYFFVTSPIGSAPLYEDLLYCLSISVILMKMRCFACTTSNILLNLLELSLTSSVHDCSSFFIMCSLLIYENYWIIFPIKKAW